MRNLFIFSALLVFLPSLCLGEERVYSGHQEHVYHHGFVGQENTQLVATVGPFKQLRSVVSVSVVCSASVADLDSTVELTRTYPDDSTAVHPLPTVEMTNATSATEYLTRVLVLPDRPGPLDGDTVTVTVPAVASTTCRVSVITSRGRF